MFQTLINLAYCSLAVFGFGVQRLVFGQLRVAEAQRVKDKFWNYVFYKFIFVFGVINVQYMDEVLLWCSWFTVVGFLHLLGQLCKDRYEYVSINTFSYQHLFLVKTDQFKSTSNGLSKILNSQTMLVRSPRTGTEWPRRLVKGFKSSKK